MTNVTPYSALMQTEETRFNSAVSESMVQKMAGAVNFLTLNSGPFPEFHIDNYSSLTAPVPAIGGLYYCFQDAIINNVFAYVKVPGNSGNTTMDVLASSAYGSPFVSIFTASTGAPAFSYLTGNYPFVTAVNNIIFPNVRPPTLLNNPTIITAGSIIRCDLLSIQGGSPSGCGIVLQYLPTN